MNDPREFEFLDRLEEFLKGHKATLRIVDDVPERHVAPFSSYCGLNRRKRVVYVSYRTPRVAEVIHEVGHLFFDRYVKKEEYDFLGWEYLFAREMAVLDYWQHSMSEYQVFTDPNKPWAISRFGDLSSSDRAAIINERIQHAKKRGFEKYLPSQALSVSA